MSHSTTSKPWYRRGLAFSCTGCGRCCRGPGGYVWVGEAEIAALAAACKMPVEEFTKTYVRRAGLRLALVDNPQGDCVFLGGQGRCEHYEDRPLQCRTYPWWPEVVASETAWKAAGRNCPGIDAGKTIHTPAEIEAGLEETKEVKEG